MGLLVLRQTKEVETASEACVFTPSCTDLRVYSNCIEFLLDAAKYFSHFYGMSPLNSNPTSSQLYEKAY